VIGETSNGSVAFTAVLNPATDTYTFTLDGNLVANQTFDTRDFNIAGNNDVLALDSPSNQDVLVTGFNADTKPLKR